MSTQFEPVVGTSTNTVGQTIDSVLPVPVPEPVLTDLSVEKKLGEKTRRFPKHVFEAHMARRRRQMKLYFRTEPFIQDQPSYPAGAPFRPLPVKEVKMGPGGYGDIVKDDSDELLFTRPDLPSPEFMSDAQRAVLRADLLFFLSKTQSAADAWKAYVILLGVPPTGTLPGSNPRIPLAYLHRLGRLLGRNRPKTRTQFMRLLSVMSHIHRDGGTVSLVEWNSLVDHAGKGWRRASIQDFSLALNVFNDMVSGNAPGNNVAGSVSDSRDRFTHATPTRPDIVTYTTLLNIATSTLYGSAVQRSRSLLQSSGLAPNRITHLCMLKYFTLTRQFPQIRSTIARMRHQNLELGLDGLNAVIWAYARCRRPDIVAAIYGVLRRHVEPEMEVGLGDVYEVARKLDEDEGIIIPDDMVPNYVTYIAVMQSFAFEGRLVDTLQVFVDMLGTPNTEYGAPLLADEDNILGPGKYDPTMPAFRALFLGFARHGVPVAKGASFGESLRASRPWSYDDLQSAFDVFMTLPSGLRPSRTMIFWIMVSFRKTTHSNVRIMRRVWRQLEEKYGVSWIASQKRLREIRDEIFPERRDQEPSGASTLLNDAEMDLGYSEQQEMQDVECTVEKVQ